MVILIVIQSDGSFRICRPVVIQGVITEVMVLWHQILTTVQGLVLLKIEPFSRKISRPGGVLSRETAQT